MIRFFAKPQDVYENTIQLSKEDSEHIRSLRVRPEELFIVCDGKGIDYVCKLGERNDSTRAEIVSQQMSPGEPSIACKVFMAYSKGDRLDYAVQKSVELGASGIVLFESQRCVAVPNNVAKKTGRLQRIALETAKQSGRGIIPTVGSAANFETALKEAAGASALSILFYECEEQLHIKEVLDRNMPPLQKSENYEVKSVSLITGPEGGYEQHEVELAKSKGINIVSLGPRILRSETAPVVALAAMMYHTGNL